MKNIIVIIICLFTINLITAQQDLFKYQAVARDANDKVMKNSDISLQLTIQEDNPQKNVHYIETHNVKTNNLGIFSLNIGGGTAVQGQISNVDWATYNFVLKVETDFMGGTNYTDMGEVKLLSVPYAIHALTVADKDDADADPQNEIQNLTSNRSGNIVTLNISKGNQVSFEVQDEDDDAQNEIQTISKSGNLITLSKNGGSFTDDVDDADADAQNEIQNLSLNGNVLSISDGNSVNLPPASQSYWSQDQVTKKLSYLDGELSTKTINMDKNINEYAKYAQDSLVIANYAIQDGSGQSILKYTGLDIGLENWYNKINAGEIIMNNYANPEEDQRSTLTADSLVFYNGNKTIGIDLATSRLDKDALFFVGDYSEDQACLGTGELCLKSELSDMTINNSGMIVTEKISQLDQFTRIALLPGGLLLNNAAKWEAVFLGEDENQAGLLRLNNGTGLGELARLGAPETVDPEIAEAGELRLNHVFGFEPKVFLSASEKYGRMCLFGENDICHMRTSAHGEENYEGSWGGFMALSDSVGSDFMWAYATKNNNLLGGGYPSEGHFNILGNVDASSTWATSEDTVFSKMNIYGFFTEGEYNVKRDRHIKDDVFTLYEEPSVTMKTGTHDEGYFKATGPNGNANVEITTSVNGDDGFNANYGAVYVCNEFGNPVAGVEVDQATGQGVIWGDTKNFRIDHPEDDTKDIVYCSLEGPEAAAYSRGTAQLKTGKVFVQFPDHFRLLSNTETMTIQLTPLYANTIGLAVIEKTTEGFWVQERMDGKGSFEFDWNATCVRKGHENFQVIRAKKSK